MIERVTWIGLLMLGGALVIAVVYDLDVFLVIVLALGLLAMIRSVARCR